MNQNERRQFLIRALLRENPRVGLREVPADEEEAKRLLRALFNVRPPAPATAEFLAVQNAYLGEAIREKGITRVADLVPIRGNLYLWRGDITTLAADAIVNAANSGLTGCYVPGHTCIDNAIHTYAGVELRLACAALMERQGHEEETGGAKITPAFNLPARYVIHTVGPIVHGRLTEKEEKQLASCYRRSLSLAAEKGVESIAFCCVSTGLFGFPAARAAEIAVETVCDFLKNTPCEMKVIFDVFGQKDYDIYQRILGAD